METKREVGSYNSACIVCTLRIFSEIAVEEGGRRAREIGMDGERARGRDGGEGEEEGKREGARER